MGKLFQYFRFKNEGTVNLNPTRKKSFLKSTLRIGNIKNDVITKSENNFCNNPKNKKYNEKECNSIIHARIFHFYKKNGNREKDKNITTTTIHTITTTTTTTRRTVTRRKQEEFTTNNINNNKSPTISLSNPKTDFTENIQSTSYQNNRINNNSTVSNNTNTITIPTTKQQQQQQRKGHPTSRSYASTSTNTSNNSTPQKTKSRIYGFMKDFLRKKFCTNTQKSNSHEEGIYVELPNNLKVINNNLGYKKQDTKYNTNISYNNRIKQERVNVVMQDVRIRIEQQPPSSSSSSTLPGQGSHGSQNSGQQQHRPIHLFAETNLNGNDNEHSPHRSPSSEEDNSPTEMNNCRRLADKPPLVKRLTMGLLRSTEDSRPLVHTTSSSLNNCGSSQTISDGYVNEGICEPEKHISSKFGDSCRQSLTALPSLDMTRHYHDSSSEFNYKKKYLRETSSANSSPKMFSPSAPLRLDYLSLSEQHELKGAAWFQAGIPREISLEVLSRQNPGAFLVRQSSTKPGCFALSLRVPPPAPKVAHYLILRTTRGYKIKGFTKEFSSLRALITHHSVMPELLPVPLSLPRPTHNLPSRRDLDDFDSYDSLNDFRKQMSDLNV